jgi:hypothetical protein
MGGAVNGDSRRNNGRRGERNNKDGSRRVGGPIRPPLLRLGACALEGSLWDVLTWGMLRTADGENLSAVDRR